MSKDWRTYTLWYDMTYSRTWGNHWFHWQRRILDFEEFIEGLFYIRPWELQSPIKYRPWFLGISNLWKACCCIKHGKWYGSHRRNIRLWPRRYLGKAVWPWTGIWISAVYEREKHENGLGEVFTLQMFLPYLFLQPWGQDKAPSFQHTENDQI